MRRPSALAQTTSGVTRTSPLTQAVPVSGRNWCAVSLSRSATSSIAVRRVRPLSQVIEGMPIRASSLTKSTWVSLSRARPTKRTQTLSPSCALTSPASCARLCVPTSNSSSLSASGPASLLTALTMPPGVPLPNSTEAGPLSTSTCSSMYTSERVLL